MPFSRMDRLDPFSQRPGRADSQWRSNMLKILGGTVGIIFLIGLLVVVGLLMLIF